MMNDRFSVELRQHLLTNADERPADGRMEAIIDGVAVTRQRRALIARALWSPRVATFPSVAVRYGFIAAALLLALIAGALAAGVAQPQRTVFEGTWTSIDPGDGSHQTLAVGRGTDPAVSFVDDFATGLACREVEVKVFTMDGVGTIEDDRLDVIWPNGGGCGPIKVEVGPGRYTYRPALDTITDSQGLTWTRFEGPFVPPPTPATVTTPPATSAPTPHEGEATFTSTINGFSMGVPAGWQTRPATEPWTGGPLDFDSPAADVLFDPAYAGDLYLLVASQPFVQMSEDDWGASVLQWTCPDHRGGEMWGYKVDGTTSWQQRPCTTDGLVPMDTNSGTIIGTDSRGYLIRLVAKSDMPQASEVARTYGWEWFQPVLETVDLRPEEAIDAPGSGPPIPRCMEITGGGEYRNTFGSPRLAATIPVGAKFPWLGYRDAFDLGGWCEIGRPIKIDAFMVDAVIDGACEPWTESPVPFDSIAQAAEIIAAQTGHRTSKPREVTIAGHAALRLEISTQGSPCADGIGLWFGNEFGLDQDAIVYLVDMDGSTLAIGVWYVRDGTPAAELAEAEAIVASLRVAD